MENVFEVKEEKVVKVLEDTKVREDLNDMVKSIKFFHDKTNFGFRSGCNVTLFNGKVVEFRDNENLYDLFASYVEKGEKADKTLKYWICG